jgi:hypothetical protein
MQVLGMAPGHVFQAHVGTGIVWERGIARMYLYHELIASAKHDTQSPWEFWYSLAFAKAFPQVAHWWFRSAWTGPLKISPALVAMDSHTVTGLIQFGDEDLPSFPWSVTEHGDELELALPYPPYEVQPTNFPLRLTMARCLLATLGGELASNTWYMITSLVQPHELELAFPTDPASLTTELLPIDGGLMGLMEQYPQVNYDAQTRYTYRLEGITGNLRTAFCELQGLKRP